MGFIPPVKSGRWWIWGGIGMLFVAVMLGIVQFAALGKPFDLSLAFRYLLVGLVLAYLCAFAGWIGAKALCGLAAAGIVVGLILMLSYSRGMSGWEELAGVVAFGMAVVAGFAAGLVLEVILWIVNRARGR